MPPGKRITAKKATTPAIAPAVRRVQRTITVQTTTAASKALAARTGMDVEQVATFNVERIAGLADTSVRYRFDIPGQMLVVNSADLPIIEALIAHLKAEKEATQP